MTAEEKLKLQLELCWQVVVSYLDFPAGKAFLTLIAIWVSLISSTKPELKMLAIIPIVSFFDYLMGTFRAIVVNKNWTPAGSFIGLCRQLCWAGLIGVSYVASLVFGRWLFVATISACLITEFCSYLENLRGSFPTSRLSLFIASLLKIFNRRYVDLIGEMNKEIEVKRAVKKRATKLKTQENTQNEKEVGE